MALTAAALSFQVLSPSLLPRAEAGYTTLCVGFSDCSSHGRSDHGYHANWSHMFWQMYPYRNCVNYVAYKVIQDGGPEDRPFSGSGNATHWGYALSKYTNTTPTKGAVAWWKAYDGVGSYGHVAYVEKVISSNEIIVSESNYGSDFSYRKITKGSGWPTGFIHMPQSRIQNVVKPHIAGTPLVGHSVRIAGGKWNPVSNPSYTWYADGERLSWAHKRSLKLGHHLVGKEISAKVTASKKGRLPGTAWTGRTSAVATKQIRNRVRPHIAGTRAVGHNLHIAGGKWNPVSTPSYTWYADGQAISGAHSRSLHLSPSLAGKRISATVGATKSGYAPGSVSTHRTGEIRGKAMRNIVRPHIAGSMKPGTRVRIAGGKWNPVSTPSYTWYVNGKAVPGLHTRSFVLGKKSSGKKVTARVTATKSGYNTASVRTATRTVR